jgi:Domain of unknown function (DUF5666)
MSAIQYEDEREEHWDPDEDEPLALRGRRRRQFFNRRSAALIAVITCAAGFYAGIRVEKAQLSSSAGAARSFSVPSLGASTSQSSTSSASATGSRSGTTGGSPGGGAFPGGALGGGNASIGTIASVDGNTIYLTDVSGNTVKVKLSSASKITKSQGVSKRALRPGDSVVIQGAKDSAGALSATTVSDSGASNTSAGSSASSSNNGSSAVNSLFGSGNGG